MTAGIDGGGILDPDTANAYLQSWKTRVDRMAADTHAMSERLGRLRVTAEDDDRLVEVTIDSTGVLVGAEFSSRIQRVAPEAVSAALLSAVRSARLRAAALSREIIVETMGPDSVAARAITERVERQLRGDDDA